MQIALDIAFAVILVISMIVGYKRGFVKGLMDLAASLIAVVAARILSVSLAPQVFSEYFESGIKESLSEKIYELGSNAAAQVQSAIDSIPSISGFLSIAGVDEAEAVKIIGENANAGSAEVVDTLMSTVVSPVATFVIRIVLFIILFFACLLLLKIITKLLDKVTKLPVLKQANKAFGFLFGAVKGIIIIFIVCAVIQLIAGFSNSKTLSELVTNSYIMTAFNAVMGSVSQSGVK